MAILPFKLYLNPYKDDNNFFSAVNYLDIIHSSLPYLEIEVGKNINKNIKLTEEIEKKIKNQKQFLSIFLIIDDFTFYIDDNYFYDEQKNLICRYSSNLSSSYEIKENIKSKYRHSIYASDYFKIYSDFFLSKHEMINIIFRHSLSMNKNNLDDKNNSS